MKRNFKDILDYLEENCDTDMLFLVNGTNGDCDLAIKGSNAKLAEQIYNICATKRKDRDTGKEHRIELYDILMMAMVNLTVRHNEIMQEFVANCKKLIAIDEKLTNGEGS